jgi:uncharacterized delta-60 repeat protein
VTIAQGVAVGLTVAGLVAAGAPALAYTSTPDPGYGTAGVVTFTDTYASAVAAHGERTFALVVGLGATGGSNRLYRLAADGSVDPSYGKAKGWFGTSRDYSWFSVTPDRGGRALLAGIGDTGRGPVPLVARVRTDGTLDTGFGRRGIVHLGSKRLSPVSAEVDARGRVLVLSTRNVGTDSDPVYDTCVTRLRRSGTVERPFGTRGTRCVSVSKDEQPAAFTTDARGRILVVGGGATHSPRSWVLRLRGDGGVDRGFGRRGVARVRFAPREQSAATSVAVVHGRIVAGAIVQRSSKPLGSGGPLQAVAFRLLPGGRVDASYGRNGRARLPRPSPQAVMSSMLSAPDGSVVALGESNGTHPDALVGALTPRGAADGGIGPKGWVVVPGTANDTFALGAALTTTRLLVMSGQLGATTGATLVTALNRS